MSPAPRIEISGKRLPTAHESSMGYGESSEKEKLSAEIIAPVAVIGFVALMKYLKEDDSGGLDSDDEAGETISDKPKKALSRLKSKVSATTSKKKKEKESTKDKKDESPENQQNAPSKSLSLEQVQKEVAGNKNLSFMSKGAVDQYGNIRVVSISSIINQALRVRDGKSKVEPIIVSTVNWEAHKESVDLENKQCARYVGNVCGIGGEGKHKYMNVGSSLVPGLIAGNLKLSGNKDTGMKFDPREYRRGDVIVFDGGKWPGKYAYRSFGHVGIVDSVIYYRGEKFLAVRHSGKNVQVDIIPMNTNSTVYEDLQTQLSSRKTRDELIKKDPDLASIYAYRAGENAKYVRVKSPKSRFCSESGNKGNIAFAVRMPMATTSIPFDVA